MTNAALVNRPADGEMMMSNYLTAHYFAGQRDGQRRAMLCIGINGDISGDRLQDELIVSGKREARRIAAERGAQPWNF